MIPTLRVKDASVRFDRIAPAGFRILSVLEQAAQMIGQDLIITSGTDSHPAANPHGRGEAYDVRTTGLSAEKILAIYNFLRTTLGGRFTVLYEVKEAPAGILQHIATVSPGASAAHLHVQPRRGTVWPPPD